MLYPTRDPARVGIQSTFLDPDSEFYPCRSLRLRIQRLWIPTRAGSPLGNQESVLQEISFSRQQPAARQGAQPSTSNVQPAGRRPLLGGVLRRCTPGGLPEIRGVLPRRRASSRTPLASWAPPNCHLGTSFLLAVPSFLLGVLRVTFLAAAAQLMRVSSGGLPEIRGVLRSVLVGANNHRGSAIKLL